MDNKKIRCLATKLLRALVRAEKLADTIMLQVIGHLKNEGHLGRNYLYGEEGDKINVLMVCAGYNCKRILRWLSFLFSLFLFALWYG